VWAEDQGARWKGQEILPRPAACGENDVKAFKSQVNISPRSREFHSEGDSRVGFQAFLTQNVHSPPQLGHSISALAKQSLNTPISLQAIVVSSFVIVSARHRE
jgi:hypothetical protein